MPETTMEQRLEVAIAATRKAGRKTLDWFGDADLTVTRKGDQSPVTAADLAAEEILKSELLAAFPDDSFLGEETGSHQGSSEFEWVVDPIDGTKNFVRGALYFNVTPNKDSLAPVLKFINHDIVHMMETFKWE